MEKLAKQLTIKYAFLQSTFWMSQCCIFSFAAVFLQSKNFDNIQIGLVLALAAVLSIILQPVVASFADKSQTISLRYIVIALMFIVFLLALILFIMPNSFQLIAIIYVLINAIQFTLNSLFNSLALEYLNKGIPLNYGLARGLGSISFAVMSYLLGIFIHHFGPSILLLIFLFSYCFVILSAFAFKITVPKSTVPLKDLENYTDANKNISYKDGYDLELSDIAPTGILTFFIKYKKFSIHLIGLTFVFYSHSMVSTYLINIIQNVGGNSTDLGISLSIAAALELPTMAAFIFLVRKIKCSTLLKISAFFFFVKVGITWLSPNVYSIYLSQIFQMFAFALFTPASIYYVNSIIEEQDKVKGQSMLGVATMGIAGTLANITGGKILDTAGVSNMLLIGTIVTAIGFLIVCFTTETTRVTASFEEPSGYVE